jgi:hypothetical protein
MKESGVLQTILNHQFFHLLELAFGQNPRFTMRVVYAYSSDVSSKDVEITNFKRI